jgi:uncharacterized protein (TIGR03089 family)
MGTFTAPGAESVRTIFAATVAANPAQPLITFYDDATGERVELSGATLANWVAKTANLLVDGSGLGSGDCASVWLPAHWQTAAVLLGCWSAGLTVASSPASSAESAVAFATTSKITAGAISSGEQYALGLAPLGAPLRATVPGWQDYITEVRGHGDHFAGPAVQPEDVAWLDADGTTVTQAELVAQARARASELGLTPGGRALIDGDAHPSPLDWLLPALAVGASIVLCIHVDQISHVDQVNLADRAGRENADVVIGRR